MAGILILVVEDDAAQSKLVSLLLEEAGHTVEIAETAEKALELMQWLLPELILVDVQLPGKDGLEFVRELRLNPAHVATPMIALSAYTHPTDFVRAREAGCNGFISKPIDTSAFARQVRSYLGGSTGTGADVPSDSGDVLAQMRNNFLAEGLEQCDTALKELGRNPNYAIDKIQRLFHRCAAMGRTLGFPGLSDKVRTMEAAVSSTSLRPEELVKALESMRRRFCAATCDAPRLPPALANGLRDLRIGLVDFTEPEVNRIRTAAQRANIEIAIRPLNGKSIGDQTGYDALIVNECGFSAANSLDQRKWRVPAVFIGSRFSLESFSKLGARAQDFIIAPWDAEEVLLRAYLLIGKTTVPQTSGEAPHGQRRRPRVLVADDDPDMVALVCATLVPFGMDCEIARSGQQALDMVRRHPPDAVVLDVNLSDLDGFEVLKKLRKNLTTESMPVLMLTGRSQGSDIALGIGFGADDYVVKPFESSNLAARVAKIISASHSGLVRR
jgi:two-component system cell cycle response regulator DivK